MWKKLSIGYVPISNFETLQYILNCTTFLRRFYQVNCSIEIEHLILLYNLAKVKSWTICWLIEGVACKKTTNWKNKSQFWVEHSSPQIFTSKNIITYYGCNNISNDSKILK